MNKDAATTAAGAGYGILMLQSVQWERTWPVSGETIKAAVAVLLIPLFYLMYRSNDAAKPSGD